MPGTHVTASPPKSFAGRFMANILPLKSFSSELQMTTFNDRVFFEREIMAVLSVPLPFVAMMCCALGLLYRVDVLLMFFICFMVVPRSPSHGLKP